MVMIVVLSIIVTSYIMTLAWAAGVQSQVASNMIKIDANYYAAEAGAQRAAWYLKNNVAVTQPLTGTINGCAYSVTWAAGSGTTQRVTSVATFSSAKNTIVVTVTPPATAPQAAISIVSNLTLKNLAITGNVLAGQTVDFQPGSASITGNLSYGSAVSGSPSVSGTTTQAAWQGVDWPTLQSTLQTAAGRTYTGNQSGTVFDFTALAGTNKVIYVNGSVTNPVIIGSGTLYVTGTVSFNGSVGTPSAPVNVVATGDVTTSNNTSYYGGIYTKGSWYRGKIDLTGTVYIEGSMNQSNNGASTLNFTSTPWFDNRSGGGGGGGGGSSTQFTNFAGITP